ncbi:O-acyltransferase like protein-like [Zerene cesonia]|uniref:O-acyltransferase like protein-like n=1 Tax=Zerene cesonia TaxID=33412 RepID=UPI0018E5134E|nr:O-acyltransferase like protein-like [Zerene cesonia]
MDIDTEYSKMPPIFKMDLYENCLTKPNGIYCLADFVLVTDTESDLLNFIQDYSSNTQMHFNHTRLRHGVCVTDRCSQFVHNTTREDLKTTLEGCLNASYWKNYKLKTKVSDPMYGNFWNYIILNGTLVIQIFFIMSGFLLAYKMEVIAAKVNLTWKKIHVGILLIYIRLTPLYAFVLLFSITWLRFCGSGPLWQMAVASEIEDCRSYGWTHLLFINNYFDNNRCMVQTWYVAANFQLLVLGYIICVLAKTPTARKTVFGIVFIIGVILPGVHTYYQNLDAVMLLSPEIINTFSTLPTFNNVYKRGHTNIPNFIMGIALGYYTYNCHKNNIDMEKYKIIVSQIIKALYAGFIKPIFGLCICTMIFGSIFKIESFTSLLHWDGWQIPAQLTYSAYIIHVHLIRVMAGIGTTLNDVNYIYMLQIGFGTILLSYLISIPFWVLVERPFAELLKLPFTIRNEKELGAAPGNGNDDD